MSTQSQVKDRRLLKQLADAGKITWPVKVNWNPKTKPFLYVEEIEEVGNIFEYDGVKYILRYHDGCFFPFVHFY